MVSRAGGTLRGNDTSTKEMHGHEPVGETDAALVARAAGGDGDAFAGLYSRYQAPMYRFALQMTGSAAVAEDIVQEVFIVLMRSLGRYDSGRPLAAYLYGIVRNTTRQRLRRERRLVPLDYIADHSAPAEFAENLEHREHLFLLRRAIVAMPSRFREVLVMCDLHMMSYELVAASLGCPVGTVRSRLHRARGRLAERMQQFKTSAARPSRGAERWAL